MLPIWAAIEVDKSCLIKLGMKCNSWEIFELNNTKEIVVEKDNKKLTSLIQRGTIISISIPVSRVILKALLIFPNICPVKAIDAIILALIIGASNPTISV